MSRIFICYRRADSSAYAGWLHDLLRQHFSEDEVFRDIDSLQGGERWVGRIDETLARCNVVLPVIGPMWLASASEGGAGRRLEDPHDRVRLELEAAIRRGVPLIPVLVGGATMPHREELPPSLQPLVDWQAMRFTDESREHDVGKLKEAISRTLETVPGELRLGTVFAGHEIEALVGRGGMGIVYRGPHVQLGRVDAIKVIAPQFAREPEFRERFVRESRLASGLQHVNLLRVYDAGEESGLLYLVMQLVHGSDLAAAIRDGPLEPDRAARIVGRAASALQAAHEYGLVHRDVKPGNILIEPTGGGDELVFLGDFGLARETTTATGPQHDRPLDGHGRLRLAGAGDGRAARRARGRLRARLRPLRGAHRSRPVHDALSDGEARGARDEGGTVNRGGPAWPRPRARRGRADCYGSRSRRPIPLGGGVSSGAGRGRRRDRRCAGDEHRVATEDRGAARASAAAAA